MNVYNNLFACLILSIALFITGCGSTDQGSNNSNSSSETNASPTIKELEKVVIAFALKNIDPLMINFAIGEELGYFAEEGLQLDIQPLGSYTAVTAALNDGQVDFATGAASFQLGLAGKGEKLPGVNYYEYTYPFKWDIAVLPDSDIKSVKDLKGKTIGIASLGTVEQQIGKAMLHSVNVDPEKDVEWFSVGEAVQSHTALLRGDIDAMIYYDTGFGRWDVAGLKYTLLPRPEKLPSVGGFWVQTTEKILKENPEKAIGFARAVAKSTVFALENPNAAALIFSEMYPETLSKRDSPEKAIKDLMTIVSKRAILWKSSDPSVTQLGFISESEWIDEIVFNGYEGKITDPKQFYTNEYIDEINQFDISKIKDEAKNYKKN